MVKAMYAYGTTGHFIMCNFGRGMITGDHKKPSCSNVLKEQRRAAGTDFEVCNYVLLFIATAPAVAVWVSKDTFDRNGCI